MVIKLHEWTHAGRWIQGAASVRFLSSYWEALSNPSAPMADDKGKHATGSSCNPSPSPGFRPKRPWRMPEEGWIKVSVDGAFLEQTGKAGIGVAIRDQSGSVLVSAWKVITGAGSAEEVEAQACREGLGLAAEWTPLPTILESDCSTVVNYLSKPTSQRTSYAFVIQEALEAARKLPRVVFHHIGRESNVIAHELAQLAVRLNHSAVWHDRVPFCVERCVTQDVNAHD